MDLNTIQLDAQLLADLYPDNLIETITTTVPEKPVQQFLGHNEKKVLVLVSHQSVPFLPDEELSFLTSVLAACKLSMADIALANISKIEPGELPGLIESQANSVLLFGIDPSGIGLPINFPQFQLQQFNKRSYLHAPTLRELEKDKEAKRQLWNSLKKLFGI
jgi:DNA polymerase III psi subunit